MRFIHFTFLLLLLTCVYGQAQQTNSYNFDFEKVEAGLPQGWSGYGRGKPSYFTPCDTVYPFKGPSYKGKVVVLVDENTLSEGEGQAMMFRAGQNTVILGSQTSGADGRVSDIFLPGGIKTWISGYGVYYPDGSQTQRIGIVPDIEVKPTVKGLAEGRDELLEKAIEVIEDE